MHAHLRRIFSFAPRTFVAAFILGQVLLILGLLGAIVTAQYGSIVVFALGLAVGAYFLRTTIRGRRQNIRIIKLRHKLRKELRRRMSGVRELMLVSEEERTALYCSRSWLMNGWRYSIVAATPDDTGSQERDWNLVFSQQHGLSRLQIFYSPPVLAFVEHDIWLVGSEKDLPEGDKSRKLSAKFVRRRLNQLGMDARFAGPDELNWLLKLVRSGAVRSQPQEED